MRVSRCQVYLLAPKRTKVDGVMRFGRISRVVKVRRPHLEALL